MCILTSYKHIEDLHLQVDLSWPYLLTDVCSKVGTSVVSVRSVCLGEESARGTATSGAILFFITVLHVICAPALGVILCDVSAQMMQQKQITNLKFLIAAY